MAVIRRTKKGRSAVVFLSSREGDMWCESTKEEEVGRVAMQPLPPGWSPTLQSGGNNQKCKQLEVAHKWAGWLHNPCGVGGPQHFRAGETIRSGSNQKWPKKGSGGYITAAAWGVCNASKRGKQSKSGPKKGPVAA